MSTSLAWSPYLVLAVLLVVSRLPQFPFNAWLRSVVWELPNLFGTEISQTSRPLYLPGTILVTSSLYAAAAWRMPVRQIKNAVGRTLVSLAGPLVVLLFVVSLVRVFVNSASNPQQLVSMPLYLAQTFAGGVGRLWPLVAPWIGAMGAFVAGSNTFSNMMFGLFQFGVAREIGANPQVVVALQAVGGAAGNMISIHNVVAVSAVVGLNGKEGFIMRTVLYPLLYYLVLAGIWGMIFLFL